MVPVEQNKFAFGRVVSKSELAFYDLLVDGNSVPALDIILKAQIIFRIWVMNQAITAGRWLIIGNADLEEALLKPSSYFIQDIFTKQFSVYIDGEIHQSTREECAGLERAAAWRAEHVEERLRDHFASRSSLIVERLKMQ